MKTKLLTILLLCSSFLIGKAQTTIIAGDHRVVNIGNNGVGDYTRSLILLHEVFNNAATIQHNFVTGTITAMRGSQSSFNRLNTVSLSTSSAYSSINALLTGFDDYHAIPWKFRTCLYQGKKYLALEVPYADAYHEIGFQFIGAAKSSGESLKSIAYQVNGQPYNQSVISNVEDFVPNMKETHAVQHMSITGNLGIGVATPNERLSVNGNIRAREIKVEVNGWPDFVFKKGYELKSLQSIEDSIIANGHLPDIPSARTIEEEGLSLGEMNKKLLQKIEELTLYLIKQEKRLTILEKK